MPVPRLFFICLNTLVLTLAEFFGLDAWNKKTVNHLVDCFFFVVVIFLLIPQQQPEQQPNVRWARGRVSS